MTQPLLNPHVLLMCLALLGTGTAVHAAPPARPQHDNVSRVHADLVNAYRGTTAYHVTIRQARVETEGRWTRTETGDVHVAYDRPGRRLRIDHPDLLLVANPDKVRMRLHQLPDRYLEQDAPDPLDYAALLQIIPFLDDPVIPDLALLLGNDTVNGLLDWPATVDTTGAGETGDHASTTIQFTQPRQSFSLRLDPETGLISAASFDVDMDPPPNSASLTYRTTVHARNEPLDPALFEFPTDGATAYASVRDMLQARSPGAQAGAPGGGHPLVGTEAKAMLLETLDGQPTTLDPAKIDEVLVIDFWASWCGPCRLSLPKLQEFERWAEDNDLPVRVYAVNLLEPPELIRRFMTDTQVDLNVLIDTDGTAAADYGVQPIPHTVVIYDGKIQHIHQGYNPNVNQALTRDVHSLLRGEEEQAPDQPAAQPGSLDDAAEAVGEHDEPPTEE